MGAFNDWVKGTYLRHFENRKVANAAVKIMEGGAYQYRVLSLKMQGVGFDEELEKVEVVERVLVGSEVGGDRKGWVGGL